MADFGETALEAREPRNRKAKAAAVDTPDEVTANGDATEGDVSAAEGDANGNLTTEAETETTQKLYLVRVPKPPVDDSILKRLQDEFQQHVNKIKAINAKLGGKRVGFGCFKCNK